MDVKIEVNPEDVKAALTKAIVDGAMGREIEAALKRLNEYNGSRFEKALETVVQAEVESIIREEVRKKLTVELRERVVKRLTDEYMELVIEKAVEMVRSRF